MNLNEMSRHMLSNRLRWITESRETIVMKRAAVRLHVNKGYSILVGAVTHRNVFRQLHSKFH